MKSRMFFLVLVISVFGHAELPQFPQSKSGGVDGGGGKSVVCRNLDGSIKSAELLDLYEGRLFYKLSIVNDTLDPFQQGQAIMERLGKGRGSNTISTLRALYTSMFARKNILPSGTGLNPTDDSDHIIAPRPPCFIEQLAVYKQDQLYIDGDIWNALNETSKSALIAHEALYKFFRTFGETNSVRTRRHIAYSVAGKESTPVWPPNFPETYYQCNTKHSFSGPIASQSQFRIFNDSDGHLRIILGMLDGQVMLTTASVFVENNFPLENFMNMPNRTYFLTVFSEYDMWMPVALSFESKLHSNGTLEYIMKIGMNSSPYFPQNEFVCELVQPANAGISN